MTKLKLKTSAEAVHATLSASGAHRWAYCAGSVEAESQFDDEQSIYAAEGTAAHDAAEHCLRQELDGSDVIGEEFGRNPTFTVDKVMAQNIQQYLDYCRSLMTSKTIDFIEERVEFSQWVPEGFGTADFISYNPVTKTITMVDLKYGKGVKVFAAENLQMILYGLGVIQELQYLGMDSFIKVKLVIVQPRLDHIDEWELSVDELLDWGVWLAERAKAALEPNAPRTAGEKQCGFCRARFTCRTKAEDMLRLATEDFSDDFSEVVMKSQNLSNEELATLYPHLADIEKWAKALRDYCLVKALEGEKFNGLKLVAGRTSRNWVDDAEAESALLDQGLEMEDVYESKLLTVAKAEKLLGKKHPLFGPDSELVVKREGKPALVLSSDKRSEWQPNDMSHEVASELFAAEDFE